MCCATPAAAAAPVPPPPLPLQSTYQLKLLARVPVYNPNYLAASIEGDLHILFYRWGKAHHNQPVGPKQLPQPSKCAACPRSRCACLPRMPCPACAPARLPASLTAHPCLLRLLPALHPAGLWLGRAKSRGCDCRPGPAQRQGQHGGSGCRCCPVLSCACCCLGAVPGLQRPLLPARSPLLPMCAGMHTPPVLEGGIASASNGPHSPPAA